jgi:hypothetical protein
MRARGRADLSAHDADRQRETAANVSAAIESLLDPGGPGINTTSLGMAG